MDFSPPLHPFLALFAIRTSTGVRKAPNNNGLVLLSQGCVLLYVLVNQVVKSVLAAHHRRRCKSQRPLPSLSRCQRGFVTAQWSPSVSSHKNTLKSNPLLHVSEHRFHVTTERPSRRPFASRFRLRDTCACVRVCALQVKAEGQRICAPALALAVDTGLSAAMFSL